MVVSFGAVDTLCYGLALVKTGDGPWVDWPSEMENPSIWCLPDVCHREDRVILPCWGDGARVAGLAAALRVEDCLGGCYGGVIWCCIFVEGSFAFWQA